MNIATLMDIDPDTDQVAKNLLKQKLLKKKNLLTCSKYVKADSADLEDLFDRDFYIELVNEEFDMAIDENSIKSSNPRVLVALASHFNGNKFNHYRPARLLSENLAKFEKNISDKTVERFDSLFADLNQLLK